MSPIPNGRKFAFTRNKLQIIIALHGKFSQNFLKNESSEYFLFFIVQINLLCFSINLTTEIKKKIHSPHLPPIKVIGHSLKLLYVQ